MAEPTEIREAASVILVRPRGAGPALEVFLLCRHRKASFMPSAFVFPGGAAEPGETDPRVTAARELGEEAAVQIAPEALHYFAHWITPSVERKRFSARMFVGALPPGQEPAFDDVETVDQVWVTPEEALARSRELQLPPPQIRTFWDLRESAAAGWDALLAAAAARAAHPHPILPRMSPWPGAPGGFALLLPWDPDYQRTGTGDARPIAPGHLLASGPSRFIRDDGAWRHVDPPAD